MLQTTHLQTILKYCVSILWSLIMHQKIKITKFKMADPIYSGQEISCKYKQIE